ncbi:DUF3466 family protein [Vibrio palustris]|uniref:GlyGly-CTERM sorting domain-containing protein n=1 Tax=Vibrio palustris TaxID=1918946 RepID=A0A1R4B2I3_9VIBR|nr:DUF3466 family protein [Vibrio palustris]SJL83106.1 hypothetical protein VPAL9027_01055 [Vibrio palustris]
MEHKTFKRTCVSVAILLASTHASAALYQVVESTPSVNGYESAYGVAITQGTDGSNSDEGCFSASATSCDTADFPMALETRAKKPNGGQAVDGVGYNQEAPFGIDNAFEYVDTQDDFEDYCDSQLRYATCESWASTRWQAWNLGSVNARSFIEQTQVGDDSHNTVINHLDENGNAVGVQQEFGPAAITRAGGVQGAYSNSDFNDPTGDQVRAFDTDGTFVSGSIGTTDTVRNGSFAKSKAALWSTDGSQQVQLNWGSGVEADGNEHDQLAQASMRSFEVIDGKIYGVGYTTVDDDKNFYMRAAVFTADKNSWTSASDWSTKMVTGNDINDDDVYSNSRLTDINTNKVAIGEAKRFGNKPENRAAVQRLFVMPNVDNSGSEQFLSGGIFFSGAGGKAEAINNYNEIVGQIDTENNAEIDGKVRRKRAFIYPYNGNGTNAARRNLFNGKGWWLDNLTNGGQFSNSNNQYRIIDAADINDAGVIAATALKCTGGYQTTAYNSRCDGTEQVVAVKLLPISGATSSDIKTRPEDTQSVSRSGGGGSIGWGALTLLALFGFRRKK